MSLIDRHPVYTATCVLMKCTTPDIFHEGKLTYSLYKVVRGISRDSCQSAILLYPVLAVNTQCQVCNVKSSHKFQGGGNPDSQNIGARSLWLLTGCLNVSRLFLTRSGARLWLVRGHNSLLSLAGGLAHPHTYGWPACSAGGDHVMSLCLRSLPEITSGSFSTE